MNDESIPGLKKDIIAIGRVLWEKDLVSGLNGNISARVDGDVILLTIAGTCLGLLHENEILRMRLDGEVLDEGKMSSERLLHTEIYKNFPDVKAVIHTHTTYTNAYFLENDLLQPRIYESRFYLGDVKAVPQLTPAVTDVAPVIAELKKNNVVVLKNHGVVGMGKNLFDCFLLIQCLEESVMIDAISRLYRDPGRKGSESKKESVGKASSKAKPAAQKKFKLFSEEQIAEIVRLANEDPQLQELGKKTSMNMDLAVLLNETGQVYKFRFDQGRIAEVGRDGDAEFLISAPENVWRAVFNREIDPFVATTQKKMNLRGDFAKISKWYAPCSRIFQLWQQVPVE